MSNRLLVATRKGLFTIERAGSSKWSIARSDFIGDNVSIVLRDPRDGSVYAGLEHGHFGVKLHRAAALGEDWQECGVPAYPQQAEGEVDKDMMGRVIAWNTVKLWALETGGADEPGVLWCGTLPGGLFRSRNQGQSWELIRSLWDEPRRKQWFGGGYDVPGIHSICVDPRGSHTVRVGVSCGGIWTTNNRGETWTCDYEGMTASYLPPENNVPHVQDPHRLVQCAARPDSLWVQHHDAIFRSGDGGARWEKITAAGPSCFGFATVVHPADGDTAWFVPAIKDERRIPVDGRFVVTRTRDGGRSFDVLDRGLPQQDAYDLVYRHGLDIDAAGDRLALGTTTGSLWISEDQGDSWQSISNHLPPVHCVRFSQ